MVLLLAAFAGGAVLTWICDTLELIPWRRARDAHWAERARLIHSARVGATITEWAIPLLAFVVGSHLGKGDQWLPLIAGAYLGAVVGGFPLSRAFVPGLTVRAWLRLVAVHLVFRGLTWGVAAAAIYWMPGAWTGVTLAIGAAYIAFRLGLTFGLGLRLLRLMGILVPASPRLARLVDETSSEVGVKVRATWEMRLPLANAFAMMTTGELLFTSSLVEAAPDDELRAICRHELAHLAESRWVVLSRILADFVLLPCIFARPVWTTWGAGGLAFVGLCCLALWLLRPRLVQALERRADKQAIAVVSDATAYARVLERIHRMNQLPAVLPNKALNTHPDLYDRMLAANVTPDFPRPEPARAHAWSAQVIVAAATFGLIALLQGL